MAKVSLAKALKVKNRRVQKIQQLQTRIQSSNSTLEGSVVDFDVPTAYEALQKATEDLWKLKTAINEANRPVHPLIYEMAELKGLVAWLRTVNTQEGLQLTYMAQDPQVYVAQMNATQIQDEIEKLEARIDDIQDALDRHNATVEIEIADAS